MTTLEILIAARALVAAGWCKGLASTRTGRAVVTPDDSQAVCPLTAIRRWASLADPEAAEGAVQALYDALPTAAQRRPDSFPILHRAFYLARWNDAPARCQGDVLRLFDRALAALEGNDG